MSGVSYQILSNGDSLPGEALPVLEDAARAIGRIANLQKKVLLEEKLHNTLKGAWDTVIIRYNGLPIGLISVKSTDKDALLPFGHILPAYDAYLQEVVKGMIELLLGRGFTEIRSNFIWPAPDFFVQAAIAAGFDHVERMNMARENARVPIHIVPPEDIVIARWSPEYLEDIARIMFENYHPEDRIINPRSHSIEGCRAYLSDIITNKYDEFLPGRSFVALHDGTPVGYLLVAALPPDTMVIYDLAVERHFRGRHIASTLMHHLIRETMVEKGHILLTVTKSNRDAIRLYERMGFSEADPVTYYIFARK